MVNPLTKIDPSWRRVIPMLYEEPLSTLNSVLTDISFQPKKEDIFNVFSTSIHRIKVVILGQDPYPSPNVALGYSFAVDRNLVKIPTSLKNIRKEVESEFGEIETDNWQTLSHWTDQGVFLLNTALTVETGNAGSHLNYWENFTRNVISYIDYVKKPIWIMMGKKAESYTRFLDNPIMVNSYLNINDIPLVEKSYVITVPHPAAESYSGGKAGFFGCNCFLKTNEILIKKHLSIIKFN